MRQADLVVIGGGITGAGVLRAAARAGLSAALVEAGEPGGRTTRASSGLLHGGLRYLPYDAATSARSSREAGSLAAAYPGLVRRQPFLWPVYRGQPRGLELVETLLELYDRLAPARGAYPHLRLTAEEALRVEPGLEPKGLRGALAFDEWAVDAAGLVRAVIEEARALGARADHGRRARALDLFGGRRARVTLDDGTTLEAGAVVNAAGPWAEEVAGLAGCRSVRLVLRRGSHWIVEGVPARCALIFPDERGRYVGLYPRTGEAWIGPTDEPHEGPLEAVRPEEEELSRLRRAALRVLPALPAAGRGIAGVRPIVRQGLGGPLSRDYRVFDHAAEGAPALITVTGGKLTLFEAMAGEAVALACARLRRPAPERPEAGWLDGRAARSRALGLLGSGALLGASCALHALRRRPRGGPAADEQFRRRYGP